MKINIDYKTLSTEEKGVKELVRTFKKKGAEIVAIDVPDKVKKTSGIAYKELFLTFADSQQVALRISEKNAIFQVLINNKLTPIKNQDDHDKSAIEMIDIMDAGRKAFTKKLEARAMEVPEKEKTSTSAMRVELQAKRDGLKESIASLESELSELRAVHETSAANPTEQPVPVQPEPTPEPEVTQQTPVPVEQNAQSNDTSSLVTEFADKVSNTEVQRSKIINKLNAISNKNTDLTNAQWLKKAVDDGKDVLRGMVDQYNVSKIEYEFAQFLKGDLPALKPSVSDKVKKATVAEAEKQYNSNSWAVNDLQGHSSEEFKNRNVPMLINPKIEATKAIIAQGVNGGAGADWVEMLQNSLARMEKQLEKWNKVNLGQSNDDNSKVDAYNIDDTDKGYIKSYIAESKDLISKLDAAGITYPSKERFMDEVNSGNRIGATIQSIEQDLKKYKQDLVQVQSGSKAPRSVVGTGGTKKSAIAWLENQIATNELAMESNGFIYGANLRNYNSTLRSLLKGGQDDVKTNEQLAQEQAEKDAYRAKVEQEQEELTAKANASKKYEVGTDAGMRNALNVTYNIPNTMERVLVELAEKGSPDEMVKYLDSKLESGVTRQEAQFNKRIELNGAIRDGAKWQYVKVEPRVGYVLVNAWIDLSATGGNAYQQATEQPAPVEPQQSAQQDDKVQAAINSQAFKSAFKGISNSLATIVGIDTGVERGYDRNLFVSSIVGKIKTQAKNDQLIGQLLLAKLYVTQQSMPKPAITMRHGVWEAAKGWDQYLSLFAKPEQAVAQTEPTTVKALTNEQLNNAAEPLLNAVQDIAYDSRKYSPSWMSSSWHRYLVLSGTSTSKHGDLTDQFYKVSLSDLHNGNKIYLNVTKHKNKYQKLEDGQVVLQKEIVFKDIEDLKSKLMANRFAILKALKLEDTTSNPTPTEQPEPVEPKAVDRSPLDVFEDNGGEAWQVTQSKWVEIMSGHFSFLGQSADVSEFKEYHKSEVKRALDEGKPVPLEVMADYQNMKGETPEQKQERYKKTEDKLSKLIGMASGDTKPKQEDTALTEAKAFLQSVIDGNVDFMDTEFADKLLSYEQYTELSDMFAQAADAYADFAVKEAKAALANM